MSQNTVQTPGPMVPAASPDYDTVVGQSANLPFQFEVLSGTTDAITGGAGQLDQPPPGSPSTPICGTSFIATAGVDATTLATPVAGAPSAGGNDGLEITIVSTTANAHTVTTAANKINGSKHIATFAAAVGNFITFVAYNGVWYVLASTGITLS